MAESKKLPLKVVPTLERDFYNPESGGGPKKVFTPVTAEFRQKLSSQVIDIRNHFAKTFREFPKVPAVARVRVRADAIAKSHRPTEVFTVSTCPIIGGEGLGDLLVSVTTRVLRTSPERLRPTAPRRWLRICPLSSPLKHTRQSLSGRKTMSRR